MPHKPANGSADRERMKQPLVKCGDNRAVRLASIFRQNRCVSSSSLTFTEECRDGPEQ
jgi:hypothetical protein